MLPKLSPIPCATSKLLEESPYMCFQRFRIPTNYVDHYFSSLCQTNITSWLVYTHLHSGPPAQVSITSYLSIYPLLSLKIVKYDLNNRKKHNSFEKSIKLSKCCLNALNYNYWLNPRKTCAFVEIIDSENLKRITCYLTV